MTNKQKIAEAIKVINNVLYFSDSSYYISGLWEAYGLLDSKKAKDASEDLRYID